METQTMKSTSLLSLAKGGHLRNISAVRVNSNGYKYITFLKGSAATNVYLGRKTAEILEEGDVITPELAKDAVVILATNAAGEPRLKFSINAGGTYSDVTSLFGVAGDVEVIQALNAAYTAREAVVDMDNQ